VDHAKWLPRIGSTLGTRIRLFCFPYAGGDSVSIYRNWVNELPVTVEVCPVQIPGRGTRVSERPFTSLGAVARAVSDVLRFHLEKPFAFFGHSMGAMIAFEVTRLLRDECRAEPKILFLSGRAAAQIPDQNPPTYNLPDAEFVAELKKFNGTPNEVLEHSELLKLILPALKADFEICQTHIYSEVLPLTCPITVFGGIRDDASREDLEAWKKQTRGRCSIHMFPGDHFFIRAEQKTILGIIGSQLNEVIARL
jgi:medium-chain acyl-[acyl-carrier-protein] hydrolase